MRIVVLLQDSGKYLEIHILFVESELGAERAVTHWTLKEPQEEEEEDDELCGCPALPPLVKP